MGRGGAVNILDIPVLLIIAAWFIVDPKIRMNGGC